MRNPFIIACLLISSSWLPAGDHQSELTALQTELKTLEAELPKIQERITEIKDKIIELNHVQNYTLPVYLKLPLTQPKFHWNFLDREKLLNGSLELVIRSEGDEKRSVIFTGGGLNENWSSFDDHRSQEKESNEISFGFISKKKFNVSRLQSAELILVVNDDIPGIGPELQGILPQGEYRATASFKIHDLHDLNEGPEYAYLTKDHLENNWSKTWDLSITANAGWMEQGSPEQIEERTRKGMSGASIKMMELHKRFLERYDNELLDKLQVAYEEALRESMDHLLEQTAYYWKEHSNKEIRAKYDEIGNAIQKLDPVGSGLGLHEKLPSELEALRDAPKEKVKSYYKEKLLECLKDVL